MGAEGDLVAARLARGCRCFGAWLGGEIAGYGWLSTTPEWIGELELSITPGHGEGYIWNCVTLPHHRRKGVFRALLAGITAQARREGLDRLWIGSVAIPAVKAFGPAGFKPSLVFDSIAVAGLHWMRIGSAARADPTLVAAAYQVLARRQGGFLRRSHRRRH